ncbi:hypothetical protein ATO10_10305 [Actibacterium atlanticum]|uniref:DUF2155 domain-containing protein n=1 Tax=Actibacterium atlanticum TaxID=1461693 RepID=A0A058ZKL2_9RHOB|nr:DUF2155 domain-containing protein [Actibacterium atlanticum]KCV81730.1 hypothetical protein ATO10_10305 [Actibacterium atlanticum]
MIRALPVCALLIAGPAFSQETIEVIPLDDIQEPQIGLDAPIPPDMGLSDTDTALDPEISLEPLTPEEAADAGFAPIPQIEEEKAEAAPGAVLRVLDRVSGALNDMELANGQTTGFGRIEITLGECRYPADNPSSDAYAYVQVRNVGAQVDTFAGWMFASSPALSALDHPRYDVWVMRCSSE